jgi:class 3 adenylate cyclase
MAACANCGQSNPPNARFCNGCGAPLPERAGELAEERKVVTVLFADLVGFTARAERLDPEDVRAIQGPYFARLRSEIESFGGTVEKYIGDAVMAVFGAPVGHGDDPERAVRAALAIRDAIPQLNAADPELELQVRIAVNTGEAIVAVAADTAGGEGLVSGDVVNTASRLQGVAPIDGVLVGEETYRSTRGAIEYRPVDPITLKGKASPVPAWVAVQTGGAGLERPGRTMRIVGRDHELGVLRGLWQQVTGDARPHLVTIFGPAGIGKTRLAEEFAALAGAEGGRVLRGRSVPYGETATYSMFAQHVKQVARIFDSDLSSAAWHKLQDAVGALIDEGGDEVSAHVGALIGLDVAGANSDRESLFYSARRLLEEVARRQPTLLVFEDIHWSDAAMLDLLETLASRIRDAPLLLLALARPELLEHRPGWGGGLPGYTALPLEPLTEAHAQEHAAQVLGEMQKQSRDAAAVAAVAEGNPLFIEELAASLVDNATSADAELPTTIRAIISARLDALPPDERAILLDAAVVGKIFWRGALERMQAGQPDLSRLLDSLEGRDLIRREPVSRLRGDHQFSFKHVLIRDTAYTTLPRPQRRKRHAAVAAFLEEAAPELPAAISALASHWREAGENCRAAEYFVVAGDQAGRGWAKEEAMAFYQQAADLVGGDDPKLRREILRRRALASIAVVHLTDVELLRRSGRQRVDPPG